MQNEDGGWGFHIESHSMMLCTALNYVSLRLLGEELEGGKDGAVAKARKWILDHGGVTMISIWGKYFLSVYEQIELKYSTLMKLTSQIFLLIYFPINKTYKHLKS